MSKLIVVLVLMSGLFLHAQDVSPEDLQKISKEIEMEVEKQVRDLVTPLTLARKLKLPFPPVAPTREVTAIKADVAKRIKAAVEAKFPISEREKQIEAAAKRYPLYKKGDEVDIQVRPTGKMARVQGKYNGFNRKGQLLIGSYEVPKVDMTEKVMMNFDPELNRKKREIFVKNKLYYFYEDRKKMAKDIAPQIESELFGAAGYFIKNGKYLPATEYLKKYYTEEKAKVSKLLALKVAPKIFARHGYVKEGDSFKKADPLLAETGSQETETPVEINIPESAGEVRKKEPLFDPAFYDPDF